MNQNCISQTKWFIGQSIFYVLSSYKHQRQQGAQKVGKRGVGKYPSKWDMFKSLVKEDY